jgi:hypothetical protein
MFEGDLVVHHDRSGESGDFVALRYHVQPVRIGIQRRLGLFGRKRGRPKAGGIAPCRMEIRRWSRMGGGRLRCRGAGQRCGGAEHAGHQQGKLTEHAACAGKSWRRTLRAWMAMESPSMDPRLCCT